MRIADPYYGVDWSSGLRGNLHCHSQQSDGSAPPQEVIAAYAAAGHGFLMLSDHDTLTTTERYAQWDAHGLVLVPGSEITRDGPHLLRVGGDGEIAPDEDRQRVIDAIGAAGGLAVMNHPNWFAEHDHCPQDTLVVLSGYAGIEIYNAVIAEFEGSPYALDRWDRLLSRGRRLWGFANDDAHHLRQVGQAWNVAFPRTRDAGGVVAALREGRFYASTGVTIERITVTEDVLEIVAPEAGRIVATGVHSKRLAMADGDRLRLRVPDGTPYVRFECWGRGERFAWSQPFFIER